MADFPLPIRPYTAILTPPFINSPFGYSMFSKPKYEAGLLIGTHIVGANSGISLNGTNRGGSVSNNFGFTAPLPDIGIWGGFAGEGLKLRHIAQCGFVGLNNLLDELL